MSPGDSIHLYVALGYILGMMVTGGSCNSNTLLFLAFVLLAKELSKLFSVVLLRDGTLELKSLQTTAVC